MIDGDTKSHLVAAGKNMLLSLDMFIHYAPPKMKIKIL